jgi:hypothetical protein
MSTSSGKAYTPGCDYDLFLSYATADDESRLPDREETRWVTYFRRCLVTAVDRKLGRKDSIKVFWDRKELAFSNAPLTRELKNALDRTAIFVAVVSRSYLHPECWCNLERKYFLASLGPTSKERAAKRRIWIIQIEEIPTAEWQEAFFPDVKSQVFYEKDADERVRLLIPGTEGKADQRFLDRVEDLAEAIAARLKEPLVRREGEADDQFRRVFLAECTADLESDRLKMKCFLEERGWLILPGSDYDDANYDALLERDLKVSLAFVQLVGAYPWKRGGFDVRQNEKARALNIPRFCRRAPEIVLDTVPEPHQAFISAADVIVSGFEDFKAHLEKELRTLWEAKQPLARATGDAPPLVRVVVRGKKVDQLWAQAFQWLQMRNILAYLLKPEESFEEKHRIEPCHGFLILCDAEALPEGPFSPRDQIEQCRIIQMREKDDTRRPPVGVAYWPPPPLPGWPVLLRSMALKMHCIVADAPLELDNFLAEVRRVAS